ncbi:MAG TPA: hypothetical protein VLA61_12300 [Ideonella sp.]|uniref:hypothetical protein n=1 Tax=Ideonella sp. TaxID=1929293 RepID=UPI002B68FAF7|nr:hypothetical protein [Ideonella sp.]HSI49044.1 hypothetical protein [Ideonella sp.]
MKLDVRLLMTALAVFFLVIGVARGIFAKRVVPQAQAWLLTGTMFGLVSLWLHFA